MSQSQEFCGVPQHSDSEGALPQGRRSLQPAPSSSSTLDSSPAESVADQAAEEEKDEEGEEEEREEEQLCSRKDSLERPSFSEEEDEEAGGLSHGEQVEDFASSVLAAISCWHHRVTMVTVRPAAAGCSSSPALLQLVLSPASTHRALQGGALSYLQHELHVWN